MSSTNWLEIAGWVVGFACGLISLLNTKTRTEGIGNHTIRSLTISLGLPLLLTLALEKALTGETIAALVGALLGLGIQKDK